MKTFLTLFFLVAVLSGCFDGILPNSGTGGSGGSGGETSETETELNNTMIFNESNWGETSWN